MLSYLNCFHYSDLMKKEVIPQYPMTLQIYQYVKNKARFQFIIWEQREREASNNIEDICLLLKKNFLSSHANLEDKLQFPQMFNVVNDYLVGWFGLHLIKCVSGLG